MDNYGKIRYELPFMNALCVEVPEEKVFQIQNHRRVALVSADAAVSKLPLLGSLGKRRQQSDSSSNGLLQVRLKIMPNHAMEAAGEGITIALIDTGLAPHYDIIKPYNRILAFKDFISGKAVPYDDDGHGTHVAGIAAGNGFASGKAYTGMAQNANVVALKALDENGNGVTSDILAAMQWIIDNKERYNIKILNLSLGIAVELSPDDKNKSSVGLDWLKDPLVMGANALVASGITVIAAAGNSGPGNHTITSPGISPYVITVGSAGNDQIPDFSSRGPTLFGLHKPDLVAPGVDIISLDAKTAKTYISQSGTSMSAPYVSGCAACLAAFYPKLSPKQIKRILMLNAIPLKKESRDAQGAGLLSF